MIPLQRFISYAPSVRMGGGGELRIAMTWYHELRTCFLRSAELNADPARRIFHLRTRNIVATLDKEIPFDDVAGVDILFSTRTPMFMFGTIDEAYDIVFRMRDNSEILLFTLSGNQHVPMIARMLGTHDLAETSEPRLEANILRTILESVMGHDDYMETESA